MDKNIQFKINKGIEAAAKIITKKIIKFITNQIVKSHSNLSFKLSKIDAKFDDKNKEIVNKMANFERLSNEVYQTNLLICEIMQIKMSENLKLNEKNSDNYLTKRKDLLLETLPKEYDKTKLVPVTNI